MFQDGIYIKEISRILHISRYSAQIITSGRKKGFKSSTEYANYSAKNNGCDNTSKYQEYIAKLKDHKNYTGYQKSLVIKREFNNYN